jgi:hypothetical protein
MFMRRLLKFHLTYLAVQEIDKIMQWTSALGFRGAVFWVVTRCNFKSGYRRFGGTNCLHRQSCVYCLHLRPWKWNHVPPERQYPHNLFCVTTQTTTHNLKLKHHQSAPRLGYKQNSLGLGVRSLARATHLSLLPSVHIGAGDYPASCPMRAAGSSPWSKAAGTARPCRVPKLNMRGAIPPLPTYVFLLKYAEWSLDVFSFMQPSVWITILLSTRCRHTKQQQNCILLKIITPSLTTEFH